MKPISLNERVQLLDVLRGFAIFGMFTVNMTADIWWGDTFQETDLALPDFVALVWVDLFTNGKFITIFSFLYGIGFFVQMERVNDRVTFVGSRLCCGNCTTHRTSVVAKMAGAVCCSGPHSINELPVYRTGGSVYQFLMGIGPVWKNIRLAGSTAGTNDFPNPGVGQSLVDREIQFWTG